MRMETKQNKQTDSNEASKNMSEIFEKFIWKEISELHGWLQHYVRANLEWQQKKC